MKKFAKIAGIVLGLLVLLAAWPAYRLLDGIRKADSDDPAVWEEDVAALEAATWERAAWTDAVLFIGSSSIVLWSTLERDMPRSRRI